MMLDVIVNDACVWTIYLIFLRRLRIHLLNTDELISAFASPANNFSSANFVRLSGNLSPLRFFFIIVDCLIYKEQYN